MVYEKMVKDSGTVNVNGTKYTGFTPDRNNVIELDRCLKERNLQCIYSRSDYLEGLLTSAQLTF